MHSPFVFLIFLFANLTASEPHLRKGSSLCTVDPLSNGTAAIYETIRECNGTGPILFSANHTYYMDKPLDFSTCPGYDFQIEGRIKVNDDLNSWMAYDAVFNFTQTRDVQLRSLTGTGIIEGNGAKAWGDNVPGALRYGPDAPAPVLIRIANSTGIRVSNLLLLDSADDFVSVGSRSDSIFLSKLTLRTTIGAKRFFPPLDSGTPTPSAFSIGNSSNVSIDSSSVDVYKIEGTCVSVRGGISRLSVTNVTCLPTHGIGQGLVLRMTSGLGSVNASFTDSIFSNCTLIGQSAPTGFSCDAFGPRPYIRNVTWENIQLVNVTAAPIYNAWCDPWKEWSCGQAGRDGIPGTVQDDIVFRNFTGGSRNITASMAACVPRAERCNVLVDGVKAVTGMWGPIVHS